ncbi:unnamed protein product [Durusdinium trenchii]|uniref:Protein kinase domain-containing protein n=1 Tax=Durusdinium trenchii TaxID=1381693 RepID=A0ABP0K826_9DINO
MWLVMPLLEGGSCAYVMRATGGQSMGFEDESVISYILREVAKAVKYFHDNMQIHRDLKAGNILLSLDARVFLSDFGVAAPLRDDKKRQTFVGTPCWMAPEVLEQTHGYDYKADIWSYGITGIELATGEAPYQRMHPLKVMKIIIEKDPPKANRKLSHLFLDLIEMCLQKDPKKRPTMEEVCARNAKFFRTADAEPLKKLLSRLPPLDQRIPPSNHREALLQPMIIDKAICIAGPADASALLEGEGLIVAAGPSMSSVVLSRLRLRVAHGGCALLLAGGCSVERCEVDTAGMGIGIEVASHRDVRVLRCVVRDCEVGISVAGAAAALLEGTHIERCKCGLSLTGLDVKEGWCDVLEPLATASLTLNEVDLKLRGWSVQDQAGAVRQAPAGEEISLSGWPLEQCNVVVPTDGGPVVLHINGGKVNATLWDDEAEAEEDGSVPQDDSFHELDISGLP